MRAERMELPPSKINTSVKRREISRQGLADFVGVAAKEAQQTNHNAGTNKRDKDARNVDSARAAAVEQER